MKTRLFIIGLLVTAIAALSGCQTTGSQPSNTSAAAQIDREVDAALITLYDTVPSAKVLAEQAKGILVFPSIVKGGFVVGAQYGRGALREAGRTVGYYSSLAASYGLQAGIQSFGYALFFMDDAALSYLDRSEGWEVGVGPSIVVLDHGKAKAITTTTLKDDVYAFIFHQQGLMAGIGLQGSKITKINP
ncbi:MAG: YSC84-related protein [Gammaproteobacteria bacterium]